MNTLKIFKSEIYVQNSTLHISARKKYLRQIWRKTSRFVWKTFLQIDLWLWLFSQLSGRNYFLRINEQKSNKCISYLFDHDIYLVSSDSHIPNWEQHLTNSFTYIYCEKHCMWNAPLSVPVVFISSKLHLFLCRLCYMSSKVHIFLCRLCICRHVATRVEWRIRPFQVACALSTRCHKGQVTQLYFPIAYDRAL